jgi:hypothetical protein
LERGRVDSSRGGDVEVGSLDVDQIGRDGIGARREASLRHGLPLKWVGVGMGLEKACRI